MLSCSIWFSAPSFWMGGGLESCCVGRAKNTSIKLPCCINLAFHFISIETFFLAVYDMFWKELSKALARNLQCPFNSKSCHL